MPMVAPIASSSRRPELSHADASPAASTPWSEADGSGQTIGLIEFDTFAQSDVVNSLAYFDEPSTLIGQLSKVDVDGGVPSPGPDATEVLLDIETTLGIAPGAQTVVYDAPFGGGASFEAVVNAMIDNKVTIISNSWAYCEDETTLADVQGIDTVFQNAAAAGISIFNGSGDDGSTCLDGAANTISVPADSPHATAVGGSSESAGPSFTYTPESWWNDTDTTPPAGMGGFGSSKFFGVPTYQNGLTGSMRSVPDVVVNADPFYGLQICQDSAGGCPTGELYGGTSFAAPQWAAFTALLNQAQGTNLGFLNPLIYPLAGTGAFHDATALGSDFGHVGLGSPNLDAMNLALTGQSAGAVDSTMSSMALSLNIFDGALPSGIFDDGETDRKSVV
jgi:kumamolisin